MEAILTPVAFTSLLCGGCTRRPLRVVCPSPSAFLLDRVDERRRLLPDVGRGQRRLMEDVLRGQLRAVPAGEQGGVGDQGGLGKREERRGRGQRRRVGPRRLHGGHCQRLNGAHNPDRERKRGVSEEKQVRWGGRAGDERTEVGGAGGWTAQRTSGEGEMDCVSGWSSPS